MSKKAFTLVEIMIVVAIIALLAAIAIPNLLRAKMSSNDSLAQSTIRALSTATETYVTKNNGIYPSDISDLTGVTPPYISRDYCSATLAGYQYSCTNTPSVGYTYVAEPSLIGTTGTTTYTITTGGVLTPPG